MEIVINSCPGEFSLSETAVKEYAQKKNLRLYVKRDLVESFYFTKSKEERKNDNDDVWHPKTNISRSDSILLEIVKTLGKNANTIFSNLIVKEVDESRNWAIAENDGKEEIVYHD
jgi:hypothetical protein